MKKIQLLIVLTVQFFIVSAQEKIVIDEVISVVATEPVYYSELQDQISQYKAQNTEITDALKAEILETIFTQKLLVYKAKSDSIQVGDNEIESQVNNRVKYFQEQIGGQEALEKYFKKSLEEIKEEMRKPLLNQMLAQRARWSIVEGVKLTPGDISDYYNKIPKDSLPVIEDQIQVRQIVKYPVPSVESIKRTKEKLLSYKQRVLNGEDFETLAILYSTDPGSANSGGLYEGIKKGMFVKEFEEVMFGLEVGQISDPFKTEYGYHIVRLEDRDGEVVDIRHILIAPEVDNEQLLESKAVLDSIKVHIENNKYTFEDAALKFSDDETTKNNGGLIVNRQTGGTVFEITKLDNTMQEAIEGLQLKDISESKFVQIPNGKKAYRLVQISSLKEKHNLNLLDDYQLIQKMTKLAVEDEKFLKWVENKIDNIYFTLKDEYKKLPYKYKWVN